MPSPSRSLALAGLFAAVASSALAQSYEFRAPKKGLSISTAPAPAPSPAPSPSPAPAPAPTYVAQASRASVTFDDTLVGQSQTAQVLLLNAGTGTLTLQAPQVSGDAFSATTTCGETLAAGASCQTDVTFAPVARGAQSGTLSFGSNATAGTLEVPLAGTGLQAEGLLSAQSNQDFGTVAVGVSASRTFTYQNVGNAGISGLQAVLSGSGLSFTSNSCGTAASPVSLAAGASCSMTVQYAPVSAGSLSNASLSVSSTTLAKPASLGLSGVASLPDGVAAVGGYTWSRPDGVTRTQSAAATYCSQLALMGGGWRLPSRTEASAVYGTPANRDVLVAAGWPNTTWAWMWTSTAFNGSNGWVWRTDSETARQGLSSNWIYESYAPPGTGYPVSCVK